MTAHILPFVNMTTSTMFPWDKKASSVPDFIISPDGLLYVFNYIKSGQFHTAHNSMGVGTMIVSPSSY